MNEKNVGADFTTRRTDAALDLLCWALVAFTAGLVLIPFYAVAVGS